MSVRFARVAVLALVLVVAPLAADAPPAGKTWRIGLLFLASPPPTTTPALDAFRMGLRELGYVEGRSQGKCARTTSSNDPDEPVETA